MNTVVLERTYASDAFWTNNLKYSDGSNYKGLIDRYGKRSGYGRHRYPVIGKNETWMEYYGQWRNDKPNGKGQVKIFHGNLLSSVVYEGDWINGEPVNDP